RPRPASTFDASEGGSSSTCSQEENPRLESNETNELLQPLRADSVELRASVVNAVRTPPAVTKARRAHPSRRLRAARDRHRTAPPPGGAGRPLLSAAASSVDWAAPPRSRRAPSVAGAAPSACRGAPPPT